MESARAAIRGFKETRDRHGLSNALNNAAEAFLKMGDVDSARAASKEALELSESAGSKSDRAKIQVTLASTLIRTQGEREKSLDLYRDALLTFRTLGDRRSEVETLVGIGDVLLDSGNSRGRGALQSSLDLAQSIGAVREVVRAQRSLGSVEGQLGQIRLATEHLESSLALARRIQAAEEEARSGDGLADVHARQGDARRALELWKAALEIFDRLHISAQSELVRQKIGRLGRSVH
ncbi:tetratricopeptide repeat protein [Streptomyces sp. M19]